MLTSSLFFSNSIVNATVINGWKQNAATWYYYNNGAMTTGWIKDGSSWYYLNNNGAMATSWIKDGQNWYYLNNSGAMATGWVKDGQNWYYLNNSGAMATGWIKDGSTWYYLNNNGTMAANTIIDGWVSGNDGAFTAAFKIGEKATIHDTLWGTYELTIDNIEITNERNQFMDSNPAEVYKVTYTYKLISRGVSDMGLYIYGLDSIVDSTGQVGDYYPNNIIRSPKELYYVDNFCTAETFIGVNNSTTKLILRKQFFNNKISNFITFIIPTK